MPELFFLKRAVVLGLLGALLALGFLTTSLASYYTSRAALREAITTTELPLISNAVYSDIRNDLIRPVQVSRAIAGDVFLHEWISRGEENVAIITRFLSNIRYQSGSTTAFFVSNHTQIYYDQNGIFEHLDPARQSSVWFYRFRESGQPWEVVIDRNRSTLFINFRVVDDQGRFIGVAGVGITLAEVFKMIDGYERRYDRTIYFIDNQRNLVLAGPDVRNDLTTAIPIDKVPSLLGLREALPTIRDGTYDYVDQGGQHFVNVRHIAELNWSLIVDKHDSGVMVPVRRILWVNLLVCVCVILTVLGIIGWVTRRYSQRIEDLVTLDPLTSLLNRRGFSMLAEQAVLESRRDKASLCVMILDIDYFKSVNDQYGHLVGDAVLRAFAGQVKLRLRASDIVSRWGGEEFVVVMRGTALAAGKGIAEKIRVQTQASVIDHEEHQLTITVSIGLAQSRTNEPLQALIERADQALYTAKRAGRNQVSVCTQSLEAIIQ